MPQTTPELSLRERKKEETRQRLLLAARQLFLDQGIASTTIAQIAELANVSRASYFNYFSSKSELLDAMVIEMEDRLQLLVEQQCKQAGSTQERIRRFFTYSADVINQTGSLTRVLFTEFANHQSQPKERKQSTSRIHRAFSQLLETGVSNGDVRDDYPLPFLIDMLISVFTGVMLNWLNDPSYPLAQRLEDAAQFFGDAIKPVAPIKGDKS